MYDAYPVAIGVRLDAGAIWLNKFFNGERRRVATTAA